MNKNYTYKYMYTGSKNFKKKIIDKRKSVYINQHVN